MALCPSRASSDEVLQLLEVSLDLVRHHLPLPRALRYPAAHVVSQVAMTGEAQLGSVPGSGRYGTPAICGKAKKKLILTWQHSLWLGKKHGFSV